MQLIQTVKEGVTTNCIYDLAGNLLSDGTYTYTYDLQNRLLTKTGAKGTTSYSYDNAGNVIKEASADGTTTYTYNGENKLIKGEKSNGESSTYTYNALGARVKNVQVKENVNHSYANTDLDNGSKNIKDYLKALSDGRATWQPVWEAEVGTTMQNNLETVTTEYVTDYESPANRDIMACVAGGDTKRYVYDDTGRRISAEFSYANGTTRGQSGENIASDTSVNQTDKIWYRSSSLDSTLFAVDEAGEVISHAIYDEWGKPLTETDLDLNYSGIRNSNNYTGYTYDEVLGLYFAQNRFYDPQTHRFTQEDVVKDGSNWYVYCGNSPVNYVDPLGLEGKLYYTPMGLENALGKGTSIYNKYGMLLYSMNLEFLNMYKHDLGDYYYKGFTKYVYTTLGKFEKRKYVASKLDRFYIEEPNTEMYVRFYLDARDSQIDPVFKMRLAAFARDYGVIIYSWDGLRDPGDENYSRGSAHTYGMAVDAYSFVKSDSEYFTKVSCEQKRKDKEYEKAHKTISDEAFLSIDMANTVANQTTLLKYGLCKPWNNKNPYPNGTKKGRLEGWHIQPIETIPEAERNTSKQPGGMKYPTAHTSGNLNPFYQAYTGGESRL